MGVEIRGLRQVQKNLEKAGKMLAKTKTQALVEVGEKGLAIVKRNTPVQDGRLRGSMTYTINGKQEGLESPASNTDAIDKTNKKNVVIIGTNVDYAARVEYTSKTGSAGFFLRSWNQMQPIVMPIMKKFFGKALR